MDENNNLSELSDSILLSVKKLVGIPVEDKSFDLDIMLNVNAATATLYQLGVVKEHYVVTSKDDTYEDIFPEASSDVISQIKMYYVYKVRLAFDSSTMSGAVIEATKLLIKEAEWRLMVTYNPGDAFE